MKIGIVTDFVDGNLGGIGTYTHNLVQQLNEIDKSNKYYLVHGESKDIQIYKTNEEIFVKKYFFRGSGYIWRYFSAPLKLKSMKQLDIVHDTYEIGTLSFKAPFKKIITVHDLSPFLFPDTFSSRAVLLHKLLFSKTLQSVDKIITVSECSKRDLVTYFNVPEDKIKVIFNGVDTKFKPLNKDEVNEFLKKYNLNFPFILFVGTLEPRKNLPALFKAYYQLKNKNINHKLVIAGKKGWKYQDIFETVNKLNLNNDIIFTDYIPENDLPALYNAADVFVYPSIYEGFGLPPLEAMACGTPVVTSNISSLPEVVGNAGITVDPKDIDMLATALYEALTNDSLMKEMTKKGLERAKLFSWKSCAVETLKVYEEIGSNT
jgi:glycosyltransferase involved in cell wall biosynthesis